MNARIQLRGPKPRARKKLKTYFSAWSARNGQLTQDVVTQIIPYIIEGVPLSVICGLCGITESTWHRWLDAGKRYLDTGEPGPDADIYGQFYEEVERAKALWQLTVIRQSLQGEAYKANWVRDLTILERRDKANWGKEAYSSGSTNYNPDEKFL